MLFYNFFSLSKISIMDTHGLSLLFLTGLESSITLHCKTSQSKNNAVIKVMLQVYMMICLQDSVYNFMHYKIYVHFLHHNVFSIP